MYTVRLSRAAEKSLDRLANPARSRILAALVALKGEPRPPGAGRLEGHDLYRIRVGVYRVVYSIIEGELLVLVVRIGHRRDVYRGL